MLTPTLFLPLTHFSPSACLRRKKRASGNHHLPTHVLPHPHQTTLSSLPLCHPSLFSTSRTTPLSHDYRMHASYSHGDPTLSALSPRHPLLSLSPHSISLLLQTTATFYHYLHNMPLLIAEPWHGCDTHCISNSHPISLRVKPTPDAAVSSSSLSVSSRDSFSLSRNASLPFSLFFSLFCVSLSLSL